MCSAVATWPTCGLHVFTCQLVRDKCTEVFGGTMKIGVVPQVFGGTMKIGVVPQVSWSLILVHIRVWHCFAWKLFDERHRHTAVCFFSVSVCYSNGFLEA